MEKLNQWMTLLANIGVLVGIVFLVIEIRQNTSQLESSSLQALTDRMDNRVLLMATDVELSKLLVKEQQDPDNLTLAERTRLAGWIASWVSDLEEAYRQARFGTLPEAALINRLASFRIVMLSQPSFQIWKNLRPLSDPEFVRWADAQLGLDVPDLETATPLSVGVDGAPWGLED